MARCSPHTVDRRARPMFSPFDRAPEPNATPREVTRAVGFLGLCEFEVFTRRDGDQAAAAVVQQLRDTVNRAAAGGAARVHRWTGSGAVLSADERLALGMVLDECIERVSSSTPLALRAGMATGICVELPDGDLIGDVVNRAAQLCGQAKPARVVVDVGVQRHRQARCWAGPADDLSPRATSAGSTPGSAR